MRIHQKINREFISDTFALSMTRFFRFVADTFFAKRYGHRAVVFVSVIASIIFQMIAGGFEGNASKIFEGIIMIIASIVLTTMIIWMAQNKNISEDLKRSDNSLLIISI